MDNTASPARGPVVPPVPANVPHVRGSGFVRWLGRTVLRLGGWRIRGNGDLRTVRAPDSLGIPDAAGSQAVAGHHPGSEGNYVHLVDGDALLRFSTSPSRPAAPYLREANARIADWQAGSDSLRFTLKGHQPLEFTLAASPRCSVSIDGKPLKPRRVNGDLLEFRLSDEIGRASCRERVSSPV